MKIKLVVSDFHIGRGRILPDGSINLLEDFVYDNKFIEFLQHYSSGEFRKAEAELIINGDFLNTLQITLDEEHPEIITEKTALEKLKLVFEGHPELFDALREFGNTPNHKITYIFGNHDPAFLWQKTREAFNKRIEHEVHWPTLIYEFDGVHVAHGNQHEALNAFNPKMFYLFRGLPEPVLNLPFGAYFIMFYLYKIKKSRPYIDKVRPLRYYLRWTLLNDTRFGLWAIFYLVVFFLKTRFIRSRQRYSRFRVTLNIIRQAPYVAERVGQAAKKILKRKDIHTVICGHTHKYLYRQYGADMEYINTGTWNDIIRLDIEDMGRHRRLTYAIIEYKGSRPRTRLKEWLGPSTPEIDVIF